jgi:mRNA-degrading endonuclease toxin of MazEF toxin-antitoxin module
MTRGEVVEFDWVYTDYSGSKVRPAVVVQADFLDAMVDDTILVQITSQKYGIPGTEVELDPVVETASGLTRLCYASCKDIATIDKGEIIRTIGYLSDAALQRIDECLKASLALT